MQRDQASSPGSALGRSPRAALSMPAVTEPGSEEPEHEAPSESTSTKTTGRVLVAVTGSQAIDRARGPVAARPADPDSSQVVDSTRDGVVGAYGRGMSITLIATGGTIASTRGPDGTVTATRVGVDLLAGLPAGCPEVDVVELPVRGSWNMSSARATDIALAARSALAGGAEGVVITHGTDVLEETAWLVELLVRPHHDAPVVFTASMRHGSEFGGDGPRNLFDAVRTAADEGSRARGTLVAVNGELHHARWVTKTHTTALCTFDSPGRGPVGSVDEHGPSYLAPSPPAPAAFEPAPGVVVPILVSHWDTDPQLVAWHRSRGAHGLVVEASGAGNVNAGVADGVLAALGDGVPVVVASRCARGEVTPVYGGTGGFATLHAAGAIASRALGAGKARLALQLAIGDGGSLDEVAERFAALVPPPT